MEFEGTTVHKEVNAYSEIRRLKRSVTMGIDGKDDKLEMDFVMFFAVCVCVMHSCGS